MTRTEQRLADLERLVDEQAARVDHLTRQAFVLKTIQEIRADAGATGSALQAAFDAGRASAREGMTPRPALRPRHLQLVPGGAR